MSLVHTCYFSGTDPVSYLTALQRHYERVRAAPGDWMPWNHRTATSIDPDAGRLPPGDAAGTSSTPPRH